MADTEFTAQMEAAAASNNETRESTAPKTVAEGRYRTLLDASSIVAEQPTIKAVLSSLRSLLSSSSRLHGVDLYVLDSDGNNLRLLDSDKELDAPQIRVGSRVPITGVAAEVLEQQKPIFLPEVSQEMLKIPDLAPFAQATVGRSTYLFPVSTYQKKYGFIAVTKLPGQQFFPEDVELLESLASHVGVALECALATDRAEHYQRELATGRLVRAGSWWREPFTILAGDVSGHSFG
jgi:GAF domain-containing protein